MNDDEKLAREIFIELIETGTGCEYGLGDRHLCREVSIKKKSENVFLVSVERHPHLFGRESIGKASSAYATVEQTFSLDLETKKIQLYSEEIRGFDIDYYALAEEDFSIESGGVDFHLQDVAKIKLKRLRSEKSVRTFAKQIFQTLDFISINRVIYLSDIDNMPEEFMEEMLRAQEETFVDEVINNWKSGRYK
jgi:hypothetical protein